MILAVPMTLPLIEIIENFISYSFVVIILRYYTISLLTVNLSLELAI